MYCTICMQNADSIVMMQMSADSEDSAAADADDGVDHDDCCMFCRQHMILTRHWCCVK